MKLVAVAVMLLASTVFGAAIVAPAQVNAPTGTVSVVIGVKDIATDLSSGMFGYGLSATSTAPVTVVLRTNLQPTVFTDATTANSSVNTKVLGTISDLGFTGAPFDTSMLADSNLMQLDLSVPTASLPVTITWTAKLTATDLSAEITSVATTVLAVPEPISALLLGLGSLFFARRRRA